ncbi:BnaA02g26720D [Brassica napus]|uniref:BnaA02g26720D protein n=1 Tax=Brassica napus TaxID=3708 RepID=A0A078FBN8_BRANA|nr:BnaA02g26720D [Brassica napus]
MGINSNLMQM